METNRESRPLVSFDWAMKRLLRNKANFEVLEGFLSVLLERIITIAQILESEGNQDADTDKSNQVDILVEDQDGELIIIELQASYEYDYFHRILYGVSRALVDHINKGEGYDRVKKVYSINIVYFDLGHGEDYVYHGKTEFKGLHSKDTYLNLSESQRKKFNEREVSDIYPEYYILNVSRFNEVAKDSLDEWMYFLKTNQVKDGFKAKGLSRVRELLDYYSLPSADRQSYDRTLKSRLIEKACIISAVDEGIEKGIAKGKMEGKMEGLTCPKIALQKRV
jgi:predicted transposase/invertase (TIGR01784 family)